MARDFSKKFTDSYIHGIKPTNKEQLFSDRDNLICIYWLNQLGPKYGDSFTLTQ